jgi:hypothetical protein
MKIRLVSLALGILMSFFAVALAADKKEGDYIKVEIKGTLETGLMAIRGDDRNGHPRQERDVGT